MLTSKTQHAFIGLAKPRTLQCLKSEPGWKWSTGKCTGSIKPHANQFPEVFDMLADTLTAWRVTIELPTHRADKDTQERNVAQGRRSGAAGNGVGVRAR